jgi:hypothetical protein
MPDPKREFLRHALATVAYRGAKAVRGAPASFATFSPDGSPRTPAKILAHIGDLFDWALHLARGEHEWTDSTPLPWDDEVARFHGTLHRFDVLLAGDAELRCPAEQLFQGPVADALTHVGQLALLRRLAGSPMKGENYFKATIAIGYVGPQQAVPKREFD